MPNLHHPDGQFLVLDRVDDPVSPLANSIARLACEFFSAWRTRLVPKRRDTVQDLFHVFLGYRLEISPNRLTKKDLMVDVCKSPLSQTPA
jgi:hypothetical protein